MPTKRVGHPRDAVDILSADGLAARVPAHRLRLEDDPCQERSAFTLKRQAFQLAGQVVQVVPLLLKSRTAV